MSLGDVFKSFCAFGAKGAAPLMDGSKFAKFARDLKLLDKQLTSTDVDIIFSKVKAKTERKITYQQFQEGLKLMAAKKFPGTENAYEKLKELILKGKGPAVHSAVAGASSDATVERLTDASKYTGSHKERFDDSGKGRGVAGRKDVYEHAGYVEGYKNKDSYEEKQ